MSNRYEDALSSAASASRRRAADRESGRANAPSLEDPASRGEAKGRIDLSRAESIAGLAPGTRLFEYEITGAIGRGGFGVVYDALDQVLGRAVAIKEYLPSSMALRTDAGRVTLRSRHYAEAFGAGLSSFINEARLLAQFDHPSLVKVFRFWEANGTAYMVMPRYEGLTVKQYLQRQAGPVSPEWLQALIFPLMDALEVLHRARVFHRDIAPDNIMLLEGGRPLLLDFGAARQRIGEVTQALTVIVKPGYAPIEQYAEDAALEQGAWTDIYALSAVMYYAITRIVPPPSVSRLVNDSLRSLEQLAPEGYPARFLTAVDGGLRVRPEARPQSIPEFRTLLAQAVRKTGKRAGKVSASDIRTLARRSWWVPMAGIALVVAALAAWNGARRDAHLAPEGASLPQLEQSGSDEPPAQLPPQRRPFDPLAAFDEVVAQQAEGFGLVASVDTPTVMIDRDRISLRFRAERDGYLYLLLLDTEGKLFLLFPNGIDGANHYQARQEARLPRTGWSMVATAPAGTNRVLAILSETPRNFGPAGLDASGEFREIPLAEAARLYTSHRAAWPFLAGEPVCASASCEGAYAAALLTIEALPH